MDNLATLAYLTLAQGHQKQVQATGILRQRRRGQIGQTPRWRRRAGVDDDHVEQLFANRQRPDWVSTGAPAAAGDLQIPASVVQTLAKNKLPLVILDWTRDDLNGPMHDDF
jgi:hypothetical protein